MSAEKLLLSGRHVRLEALAHRHVPGLANAAASDPSLYRWSPVPQGKQEATRYVETALAWQEASTAIPFAIIRLHDDAVIGSTRFWNLERWSWPSGHPSYGRGLPDACEIGYTWLISNAIRTSINTEIKFLMLAYAFETWHTRFGCAFTQTHAMNDHALRWSGSADGSRVSFALTAWRLISSLATPCVTPSWRRNGKW